MHTLQTDRDDHVRHARFFASPLRHASRRLYVFPGRQELRMQQQGLETSPVQADRPCSDRDGVPWPTFYTLFLFDLYLHCAGHSESCKSLVFNKSEQK